MAKDYAKRFYKSKAWRECRVGYITSVDGLCERCLERGVYTPGYIVHHIKHITPNNINDPNITLNWDNLMYVCHDCHNRIHGGEKDALPDGLAFDRQGNLIQVNE